MVKEARDIDWLISDSYVPSSVERKKAVLMYFFVWIVAALSKEEISIYEFFHLKQAIWRWMIFFVSMIVSIIFVFIPYLWVLPILVFIVFLVIWIIFVKQAYDWEYVVTDDKILLPLYASLWWWVINIFELKVYKPDSKD